MFLAGRGFGKTLTLNYDLLQYALTNDNVIVGVVAPTYGDLKRIIFDGDSGLLKIIDRELLAPSGYNKSNNEIRFWNGSRIQGFPAIEPDRLRGVQFHRIGLDELASYRYRETFDNVQLALRLGQNPKCIITTTPRPIPLIKELVQRKDVQVIRGSTFENIDNLAPSAIAMLEERYKGTRVGRQELYGEILEDVEGALFHYDDINEPRVEQAPIDLQRIVVAIDPAVTSNKESNETGIVVCARDDQNNFYVLDDQSGVYTPDQWIKKAIALCNHYNADRIIAEANQGGDLIERLLRTQDELVPYSSVRATKGKYTRAEPIASLFEQRRVKFVGYHKLLEEQLLQFTGKDIISPDRVDALVWGLTSLSQNSGKAVFKIS